MIDFLLVWRGSGGPVVGSAKSDSLLKELAICCIVEPKTRVHWQAPANRRLSLFVFGHDVIPIAAADRVAVSADGCSIFDGWMLPDLGGSPLRSVTEAKAHLDRGGSGYGEYLFCEVDAKGNGRVLRNLLGSVQLYVYETSGQVLLATRPSLIASYLGDAKLSAGFARWVSSYSVPQTQDSIFDGIACVPPGTSIRIEGGRPITTAPSANILLSEQLQLAYRTDRTAYWDKVFSDLIGLMRVVELTDIPIEFPLSGGKDSRLLLGLLIAAGYRDRISRVFTNGPDFSPEVRSARLVADHFGLPHEAIWATGNNNRPVDEISAQLPLHLLVTEGEMSPIDLTTRTSTRAAFQMSGQESGLRNIAGKRKINTKEDIEKWLFATLGEGDMCGILTSEATDRNRQDARNYLARMELAGVPFEQIPTKHRVDYRGSRWVSRVWGANNATSFSPQIFRSEVVTLATYNSGARSRQLEEFHFEMLLRIDPNLVELPFAGQSWDADLLGLANHSPIASQPLTWPEGFTMFSQRATYGALQAHFGEFAEFIADRAGPVLRSVIDLDRLLAFDETGLKQGHVQPLWQVFQCALFETTQTFSALRTKSWQEQGIPDFRLAA